VQARAWAVVVSLLLLTQGELWAQARANLVVSVEILPAPVEMAVGLEGLSMTGPLARSVQVALRRGEWSLTGGQVPAAAGGRRMTQPVADGKERDTAGVARGAERRREKVTVVVVYP
jgi:hypothetical protein